MNSVLKWLLEKLAGTCAILFCLYATAIPCSGWWMDIHLSGESSLESPAELLVTDPRGHRTGYDPSTKTVVRELPEGVGGYGRERIDDDVTGELGPESVELSLSGPEEGIYWLTVTGVRRGRFWLELAVDDIHGKFAHRKISGEIDQGRIYRYRVDYSQDNADKTEITADTYRFSGFMSPLASGEPRSFKLGRTIPIKFRVKRQDGGVAAGVMASLVVRKDTGSFQEGKPPEKPEPGWDKERKLFRYDRQFDGYVYNLTTRQLSPGIWRLRVILDDGSMHETTVGLQ